MGISFHQLNFMDADYCVREMYDVIFCRNVLIYFDDESRRNVVNHFYDALNPKGYIFLGHSESVGRITSGFRLKKTEGHLMYTKD